MTNRENSLDKMGAFNTKMWAERARGGTNGGYEKLGWVGNQSLLEPFTILAELTGSELVVDVGTGSLAVVRALSSLVRSIVGFDVAVEMIKRGDADMPANSSVFVGDACAIPIESDSVDVVTTRMVYHHLPEVSEAAIEARRVLKPGGKLIVSEYVAPDVRTLEFDNVAFQIKEAGRHLWTGEQLASLIANSGLGFSGIGLYYATMPNYSVRDWVGKSGLSIEKQMLITDHYRAAPSYARAAMNIQNVGGDLDSDRDALVDRPFAFIVATK